MKDVKRCHTRVQIGCDDWNTTLEAQRCIRCKRLLMRFKDVAYHSDDKCRTVMAWMHNLKREMLKHSAVCRGTDKPALESPIDRDIENDIVSIPNPSQRILTPIAVQSKGHHHLK